MAAVLNPTLRIEPAPTGGELRRLVLVHFDLELGIDDVAGKGEMVERALVRGVDLHDGLARPRQSEVIMKEEGALPEPGLHRRELSTEVNRKRLDVQQDWWRTDHGGGVDPIVEVADHLIAEVNVILDGEIVAEATTPIVTGSWGVLGPD